LSIKISLQAFMMGFGIKLGHLMYLVFKSLTVLLGHLPSQVIMRNSQRNTNQIRSKVRIIRTS